MGWTLVRSFMYLQNLLYNYVQQKLDEANKRANDSRIMIGKHNLECDGAIRASRFGDSRTERLDGVHLRGNSGMISYTRSVANILVAAGLTSEVGARARAGETGLTGQPSSYQPSS